MIGYVFGIAAVITLTIATHFLSGHDAAMAVSLLGTMGMTFGTLAYIVFLDSRRRWPGVGTFNRFARVITFYRER